MAKRARGTHSRPGQRARLQRRTPLTPRLSSPVGPPTVSITPEEVARAAELEAEIVAAERQAERQAERAARPTRDRIEPVAAGPRVRSGSIAVRAAEEYGYVSRDVRRIILIGGSLVTLLVGLWAVIQVTGTRLF